MLSIAFLIQQQQDTLSNSIISVTQNLDRKTEWQDGRGGDLCITVQASGSASQANLCVFIPKRHFSQNTAASLEIKSVNSANGNNSNDKYTAKLVSNAQVEGKECMAIVQVSIDFDEAFQLVDDVFQDAADAAEQEEDENETGIAVMLSAESAVQAASLKAPAVVAPRRKISIRVSGSDGWLLNGSSFF